MGDCQAFRLVLWIVRSQWPAICRPSSKNSSSEKANIIVTFENIAANFAANQKVDVDSSAAAPDQTMSTNTFDSDNLWTEEEVPSAMLQLRDDIELEIKRFHDEFEA